MKALYFISKLLFFNLFLLVYLNLTGWTKSVLFSHNARAAAYLDSHWTAKKMLVKRVRQQKNTLLTANNKNFMALKMMHHRYGPMLLILPKTGVFMLIRAQVY